MKKPVIAVAVTALSLGIFALFLIQTQTGQTISARLGLGKSEAAAQDSTDPTPRDKPTFDANKATVVSVLARNAQNARRQGQAQAELEPEDDVAEARENERVDMRPFGTPLRPGEAVQVTPEEEPVLLIYEALSQALEDHNDNCEAIAQSFDAAIRQKKGAVDALASSRARLSPAELAATKQRLETANGKRLGYLREQVRRALSLCKDDERLLSSLRDLARWNGA